MSYNQESQQQSILLRDNRIRQKYVKHQLFLVSILNFVTLLCFVFAMSYYKWLWVELEFKRTNLDSKIYYFWINLLYLKQDKDGSSYEHFFDAQKRICINNVYCSAEFYEYAFVGYLCFCIFMVAALMQLFEIFKKIYYIVKMGQIMETKNKFQYMIEFGTYVIGLTLFVFSAFLQDNKNFHFGISFYLCAGALVPFIAVIIYGHFSIRRMVKQALIQNLLDKQKTTRCENIMRINTLQSNQQSEGQQKPSL